MENILDITTWFLEPCLLLFVLEKTCNVFANELYLETIWCLDNLSGIKLCSTIDGQGTRSTTWAFLPLQQVSQPAEEGWGGDWFKLEHPCCSCLLCCDSKIAQVTASLTVFHSKHALPTGMGQIWEPRKINIIINWLVFAFTTLFCLIQSKLAICLSHGPSRAHREGEFSRLCSLAASLFINVVKLVSDNCEILGRQ